MAQVRSIAGIAFCTAGFHTEPIKVSCCVYLASLPHARARASQAGIQSSAATCCGRTCWQQLTRNTSGASCQLKQLGDRDTSLPRDPFAPVTVQLMRRVTSGFHLCHPKGALCLGCCGPWHSKGPQKEELSLAYFPLGEWLCCARPLSRIKLL